MPLRATEAKKLVRHILEDGEVEHVGHVLRAMADDKLTLVDVENILRAGICREAEFENGEWRYHIDTTKIVVVFSFRPEPTVEKAEDVDPTTTKVTVVTVWEIKKK